MTTINMKNAFQMGEITRRSIMITVQKECKEIEEMLVEAANDGKKSCDVNLSVFHMETKKALEKMGYTVVIYDDEEVIEDDIEELFNSNRNHTVSNEEMDDKIYDQNVKISWPVPSRNY